MVILGRVEYMLHGSRGCHMDFLGLCLVESGQGRHYLRSHSGFCGVFCLADSRKEDRGAANRQARSSQSRLIAGRVAVSTRVDCCCGCYFDSSCRPGAEISDLSAAVTAEAHPGQSAASIRDCVCATGEGTAPSSSTCVLSKPRSTARPRPHQRCADLISNTCFARCAVSGVTLLFWPDRTTGSGKFHSGFHPGCCARRVRRRPVSISVADAVACADHAREDAGSSDHLPRCAYTISNVLALPYKLKAFYSPLISFAALAALCDFLLTPIQLRRRGHLRL